MWKSSHLRAVEVDPDADLRADLRRLQSIARGADPHYRAACEATFKARADHAAIGDRLSAERERLAQAKAALPSVVGTPGEAPATAALRDIKNGIEDLADLAAAAQTTVDRLAAAEAELAPSSTAAIAAKAAAIEIFRPHIDALRDRILRNQEALVADRLALCALQAEGVHSSAPLTSTPFGPVDPATAPIKLPTPETAQHAISRGLLPAPEFAAFRALLGNADAPLPDLPD